MVHSAPEGRSIPTQREAGPVQVLCKEIGFNFDRRLERDDVFLAFIRELVEEVHDAHRMASSISEFTGKPASEAAGPLIDVARSMVATDLGLSPKARENLARHICDRAHEVNPDDPGHSCDHLVDMLSSCAAAVWFGLETPCRSRHAANAAQHVWERVYGVSRFDSQTSDWQKSWARTKLQSAIVSLLVAAPAATQAGTKRSGVKT